MGGSAVIGVVGVFLLLNQQVGEQVSKVFTEKGVLTEASLPAALEKAGALTTKNLKAALKEAGFIGR